MSKADARSIEIRDLTTTEEFAEAVKVQRIVWGFGDIDLLPVRLFVVAHHIGGQVLGAFDGDRMIAFLLGLPGLKAGGFNYIHGHMLGVMKEYRDSGIGRLMKLRQRDDAVERNIALVEWTFDPLELRNAYFNMERLGAIIRRYVPNQYGMTTSKLHGGLPTDRCVAEWWVSSPRVTSLLNGTPEPRLPVEARIPVPSNIAELRQTDPRLTREIQKRVADQFAECFDRGLAVTGFERSEEAGTYLLAQWESK